MLLVLAIQLRANWAQWRLNTVEHMQEFGANPVPLPHLVTLSDPDYRRVVIASSLFSLGALAVLLAAWAWRCARRRARPPELGTLIMPEAPSAPMLPAERRRFVRQVLALAAVGGAVVLLDLGRHWFSPPGLRVTYYRDVQLRRVAGWGTATALFRDFREDPAPWWLPRAGFSSRWTAQLDVPRTGPYIFYSQSCDGLRLYLDGRLVLDNWRDQEWLASGKAAEVPLTAGRHALVLEHYARDTQGAALRVRWCGGDIPPNSLLAAPYLLKSR